ncbi:hypothetical protein DPMN_177151 [Dreissena polymorpha]|uniref:Fibronectin type-III domain-containing protein n=1 Tax=Dreissena polymorpha TaxID=45954 RepID=A0A9D4IIS2_DREPO|nr:hypothetical protein DPMN_177151 [Dreissena polymorpha]
MCKSRIVTGLKTGVKFKFRVMAKNIYGIAEPLETDCPVLVKNRFEPAAKKTVIWKKILKKIHQLLIQLLCPQLQPTSPNPQPASPKPQPASPKFQPKQQPALSERKRRKEKCGLLKNKLLLSDNWENIFTLQSCQINTRLRRAEKKNLYC